MDKSFWGPSTWTSIHFAGAGYTPDRQRSFTQFIYSLRSLLPCNKCCEHLTQNLQVHQLSPHYFANANNLLYWTYQLHDLVNKQLRKTSISYRQVQQFYFNKVYPEVWGQHFWRMIHSFAATYTPNKKTAFKQFIYALPGILPCDTARANLLKNMKTLPLTEHALANSHNLFLWTYQLHDLFNRNLGKRSPNFEEVKETYFNDRICELCGK